MKLSSTFYIFVSILWFSGQTMTVSADESGSNSDDGICDLTSIPVGAVATPADGAFYEESRRQWASDMGSSAMSKAMLSPEAIVYCLNEDDVLGIIDFASKCGYKLSVRSGGHQYSGYSSCEAGRRCIQVDMSAFNNFDYDDSSNLAVLGVGLKIEEVHRHLVARSLMFPLGACNSVGIGGHLQTSSLGFFTPSFGAGLDLVKSFRIALADGTIQQVSPSTNNGLYESVLGGGPGSWGIVLSYEVEPIKASDYPHSAGFRFVWPYSHDLFVNLGKTYTEVVALEEAADDIMPLLVVTPPEQAPTHGSFDHYISLTMTYTGKVNGDLWQNGLYEKFVQPFKNVAEPAIIDADGPIPLHYLMASFVFDFNHKPFRYHVGSVSTSDFGLDADFWEMTANEMDARMAVGSLYSSLQFQGYGGSGPGSQLNRNAGLNAFPFRDLKIHMDDWVFFAEDDQESIARDFVNKLRSETVKYWRDNKGAEGFWMTTRTTDVEEMTLGEDLWKEFYPSRQYFRKLQLVKQEVDPCDLFSTDTTIPLPNNGDKNDCPRG